MLKLPDLSPLVPWYEENKRDLPFRHTRDPYCIWVSEIMLQQTRVETGLPYYLRFIETLPTVEALANAPEPLLLKLWEGLGYYSRVRNMKRAAQTIIERFGGKFPHTFEEIRSLCGIGDYTAGAISSIAFDLPYPTVDGNVLRVCSRLLCYDKDVLSTAAKKELTEAVTVEVQKLPPAIINQALMELGATVCLPNGAPRCEKCPLSAVCKAHEKGCETTLPVKKKAAARKIEYKTVLILHLGDKAILARRPEKGLLSGLFEPYSLAGQKTETEVKTALEQLGLSPVTIRALGPAKHIFSHLEWHMTGFDITLDASGAGPLPEGLILASSDELDTVYALPSAYRAYRAFM